MDLIWEGLRKALELLLTLGPEVLRITLLSLKVSGLATLLSVILGLGLALGVALNEFPGKRLVIALVNTGMGLPPVVVGLFVTVLLWRNGPFGFLGILYTPAAIILAQSVIATPIIAGLGLAALQHLPPGLRLQILALGAKSKEISRIMEITTATVMETSRGNFDVAFALSFILLLLAFGVNALLTHLQQRGGRR